MARAPPLQNLDSLSRRYNQLSAAGRAGHSPAHGSLALRTSGYRRISLEQPFDSHAAVIAVLPTEGLLDLRPVAEDEKAPA